LLLRYIFTAKIWAANRKAFLLSAGSYSVYSTVLAFYCLNPVRRTLLIGAWSFLQLVFKNLDVFFLYTGNGYCRSEAILAVYLQKKESAKRIYATLVHSKTNSDGYKDQGVNYCLSVTLLFRTGLRIFSIVQTLSPPSVLGKLFGIGQSYP